MLVPVPIGSKDGRCHSTEARFRRTDFILGHALAGTFLARHHCRSSQSPVAGPWCLHFPGKLQVTRVSGADREIRGRWSEELRLWAVQSQRAPHGAPAGGGPEVPSEKKGEVRSENTFFCISPETRLGSMHIPSKYHQHTGFPCTSSHPLLMGPCVLFDGGVVLHARHKLQSVAHSWMTQSYFRLPALSLAPPWTS